MLNALIQSIYILQSWNQNFAENMEKGQKGSLEDTEAPFINVTDSNGKLLACIIRSSFEPTKTTFISPSETNPQYGIIAYKKNHEIPRHYHNPIQRTPLGTPETLVVRKGSISAVIYDDEQNMVNTFVLNANDIIVLIAGGHGFTFLEDAWLFEVKQGPYAGSTEKDKVHF
eukprot:g4378.t1